MARRGEAKEGGPRARQSARLRVFVFGAGKLGTSLARALRARGAAVTLRPARKGPPARTVDADVFVLAVRDRDLERVARELRGVVPRHAVVVHVAGALDAEPLAALREVCAGVAQMHPMISFASARFTPELAKGNVHVQGDPPAASRARRVARLLGMTPRTVPDLDTVSYHAAAGLVANGSAALAAAGAQLLEKAGVARDVAPKMLGPLLRSVAENIEALGFPEALTGPVRRGDATGLEKHLATLQARSPAAVPFYLAAAAAQLPLARALGEAQEEAFDAIARVIEDARRQASG